MWTKILKCSNHPPPFCFFYYSIVIIMQGMLQIPTNLHSAFLQLRLRYILLLILGGGGMAVLTLFPMVTIATEAACNLATVVCLISTVEFVAFVLFCQQAIPSVISACSWHFFACTIRLSLLIVRTFYGKPGFVEFSWQMGPTLNQQWWPMHFQQQANARRTEYDTYQKDRHQWTILAQVSVVV